MKQPNKKTMKKIHVWVRAVIQLLYFLFIPSAYTAAFNGVKYIQRLKPEGGMPNSSGCTPSEAGKLLKVPFSAEYVFWK